MDWGYNAPGVILWWAHIGDDHWHIARELKFQGLTAETVARGNSTLGITGWKQVNQSLGNPKILYIVADPSMWAQTGQNASKRKPHGQSIAETLEGHGMRPMVRGDNDRKNGWQRCHELLRLAPDGQPWLTIDASCTYGLRSLPAQMSDKKDPDDVNTSGDDHWVDAWRYGAMSRFVASRSTKPKAPPKPGTYGWMKAQAARPVQGLLARRSA